MKINIWKIPGSSSVTKLFDNSIDKRKRAFEMQTLDSSII